MRADLPRGVQAAQIVHAAGESVRKRVTSGTHAVVLAVSGEDALREVAARLDGLCVDYAAVVENDAPYSGQLTALGVAPVQDRRTIRRALSSLPLLGRAA